MKHQFWLKKTLDEFNQAEWEALCDGCAQCCLIKLEDEDSGEIYRTNVSCQLLDTETCRCIDYPHRFDKVSECVEVTLEKPEQFKWMPASCAYRLLYEGKSLFDWHPLISNDPESVHEAEVSVRHFALSEDYIHPDQLEDHITEKIK